MSFKYSFKDALLEAGVLDYYEIPADREWEPSDGFKKKFASLSAKKDPLYKRILSTGAGKAATVAAAVMIVFGVSMSVKAIREPLFSFFGGLFGFGAETTQGIGTDEITEPTSTETSSPVATAAETTETETTKTETETTEPVFDDWDDLSTQGRVERAMYEIIHYGINYQRFRYLCGDEHADDIHDDGGYYLGEESDDNFTYGYFLDLYDTETDPMRKQLMFVYISSFLTDTWSDETRTVPYTTKYLPDFNNFEEYRLSFFDATYNEECDKWISEYYYDALCKYVRYMTEDEVKTKYAPSYKLLKKFGFNDYANSANTFEKKAERTVTEFIRMALSVKYGIEINDPSSKVYFRYNEEGRSLTYEPGDKIYAALLNYYTKAELDGARDRAVYEQRGGIKTIDNWREYFISLTTKSIADEFIKENKYFLTASDGSVLTVNMYHSLNINNLNIPYAENVDTAAGKVYMCDVDENRYYTVQFREEDGKVKIVGGTLVTEWLYRTLSAEKIKAIAEERAAETFKIPETTEEWIDYLFNTMVKNGYSKEKWEKLQSFGLSAFDRLVPLYKSEDTVDYANALISVFAQDFLLDEIRGSSVEKRYELIGTCSLNDSGASDWLMKYRSLSEAYASTNNENTVKTKFPMMHRFLSLFGFDDYAFSPSDTGVSECIDKYISDYISSAAVWNSSTLPNDIISNLISEKRRDETLDFVLQNYYSEENGMRRSVMSWLFFSICRLEITDFTDGSELSANVVTLDRISTNTAFVKGFLDAENGVSPFLDEYTAFSKMKAKGFAEEIIKTDYPYTYKVLTAAGFDEYDKKEVDIADKSHPAIKAALDLFMLLKCGTPFEDGAYRVAGREKMSDVYDYFGKYFSKEIIDNLIAESGFTISDGVLYYEERINASGSRVRYDTVKPIGKNGDTATVEAALYIPDPVYHQFKYVTLTFEVYEDGDGVKISGGNYFDVLMSPAFNYIDSVFHTTASYMYLREGQKRYLAVKEAAYSDYESLPDELKEKVKENAGFPISYIDGMFYEAPLRKTVRGYIYDDLIYRETEVFRDGLVFISNAPGRVKPAFDCFSYPGIELYDDSSLGMCPFSLLFNMKDVKLNGRAVEFSLDFEVDGAVSSYSFIIDYDETYGMILTGGTFVTDILLK